MVKESQPLDESGFRKIIYEKYREHFEHVYRLHLFAQKSLVSYRGFTQDSYQNALQLIFPRALKSFDAVHRLCAIASCEDAGVILRSLLNLMAVTRWISSDPGKRAKRYMDWYWIQMRRDAALFPPDWLPFIEKKYSVVKPQFEHGDTGGRAKLVRQWYEPEANTIRDLFEQTGLAKEYEEGYRPLSGIEHSDTTAFFAMVVGAQTVQGERKLDVQSDLFVRPYLRNAFQYFADIFGTCNRILRLADDTELRRIVTEGMQFYKSDMQAGVTPT